MPWRGLLKMKLMEMGSIVHVPAPLHYQGIFVVTESVTVEKVLDLMSRMGLILPQESFRVFA